MAVIDRPSSIELRDAATEAGDKLRELRNRPADQRGDTYDRDLRDASALVVDLDREFENTRNREQYDFELALLEAGASLPEARGGDASGVQAREARTAGDIVTQTADYVTELRARVTPSLEPGEVLPGALIERLRPGRTLGAALAAALALLAPLSIAATA